MAFQTLRKASDDRVAAAIHLGLGVLFVMTGVMKLAVPTLGAAFAGQLAAADIPFQDINRWVVPFLEIGVGGALLLGFYTRVATLFVISIMIVETYTHLAISDPSLFPLQPEAPIIPAFVLLLSAYTLLRGGTRPAQQVSHERVEKPVR